MTSLLKGSWNGVQRFWKNEDGVGTLEMVLIIAVLIMIAILFKDAIKNVVGDMLSYMDTQSKTFKQP